MATDDSVNIKINTTADTKGVDNSASSFLKLSGAVAAGQAIYGLASSAISKIGSEAQAVVTQTEDWTKSTIKLQREMGVSAETASSLLAVTRRFGVDGDAASKSFGLLAKQVEAAAGGSKSAEANFTHFGLTVKDVHGNTKDFNTIFGEIADKFKDAPNGMDKTAEAMKLFGRSGKDMLPILNLGSAGIKDLEDKAKSMGLVLTQSNVDSVRKLIIAQKDWKDSTDGLRIQIGLAIIPKLAEVANLIVTRFVPAIKDIGVKLEPVIAALREASEKAWKFLKPSFEALHDQIITMMPTLKILWNDVLKPLAIVMGVQLVAAIYIQIKMWTVLLEILKVVTAWGQAAGKAIERAWHDVQKTIEGVIQVYKMLKDLITGGDPTMSPRMATQGWREFAKALWAIRDMFTRVVSDVVSWWQTAWRDIKGAFDAVINAIGAAFTQFRTHFIEDIGFAIAFVITLPYKVIAAFMYMGARLIQIITETSITIYQSIFSAISDLINWISNINWGDIFHRIVAAVEGVMSWSWNVTTSTWSAIINWVSNINWSSIFSNIGRAIWSAAEEIWRAISSVYDRVTRLDWGNILATIGKSLANNMIDMLQGAINGAFSGIPGAPKVHFSHFEHGVRNFGGGLAVVGDVNGGGGELVNLPKGSDVFTNQESKGMLNGMGGTTIHQTNNIYNQLDLDLANRELGWRLSRA